MFKSLKNKISNYLARKKYLRNKDNTLQFNNFFNGSNSFLVLMPNDEKDFRFSVKILDFLNQFQKELTILVPVKFFSKIQSNNRTKIIQYSVEDVSKFNLPRDFLANKINKKKFDIVIDLERIESLLYSSLTNLTESKYKIGFHKEKLNEFYNILIANKDRRAEFCYDDMIESIKMF